MRIFFFSLSKQILGITRRIGILGAECLNPPGPARHMRLRPRDTGDGLHGHEARPVSDYPYAHAHTLLLCQDPRAQEE